MDTLDTSLYVPKRTVEACQYRVIQENETDDKVSTRSKMMDIASSASYDAKFVDKLAIDVCKIILQ